MRSKMPEHSHAVWVGVVFWFCVAPSLRAVLNQTVHMLLFIGWWIFGRKLQFRPSTEEAHVSPLLSRIDDTQRDHAGMSAREEE